ncbi:MAG: hypothetical protein K940chlam7_01285 [Chlamydiae bacterium]|nr:hypothetical protein [Chlamydiota bacterium]
MSKPKREDDDFLITFTDCLNILKKGKRKIVAGALALSVILSCYTLTRPIQYKSEATFKEKSNSQGEVNTSSLASVFLSGISTANKSEAKTMMKSRKLQEQVIKSLWLQATLTNTKTKTSILRNVRENVVTEYYYLRKKASHPLPDPQTVISAEDIDFSGEVALNLKLVFDSENTYQVFGPQGEEIGGGRLGTPFSTHEYRFTIFRVQDLPLTSETHMLTLSPLANAAKALLEKIEIEFDKDDTSLLKLTYRHRDRHKAYKILNQLMASYRDYLQEEHERIAAEQIAYLHNRENEMGQNLREMIEEYANKLSSEVTNVGYADSAKAMEFLSSQMQGNSGKLFAIELELKRQEKLKEEGAPYDSRYTSNSTPKVVEVLISELRTLKQESDSIELALRNSSLKNIEEWQTTFSQQVVELEEIRQCSGDAKKLLASLENDRYPLPAVQILDHPKYMVRAWYDKLSECDRNWKTALRSEKEDRKAEWKNFKTQFISYVTNLLHLLDVSEKTMQERLAHQQAPQFEFQGVNLQTASELYLNYSKLLSEVEAQVLQYQFIIDQLQDPEFEISSLSSLIDDSVTRGMVDRASELTLALQDEVNRSSKEKERIKRELETEKRFLGIHLNQTVQLMHLREGLLKDKIQSLQNATLELCHQRISILENQLSECIASHINTLKQERQLLEQFQLELRHEMAQLPQKWASEKLIEHQVQMNTIMVEEITKLVETKNITNNLEIVQSAPVDLAIPSTHPVRPKLVLFAVLGGILGAFLTLGGLLSQLILKGVPASEENLKLAGVHVSGVVKPGGKEQNLKTLRRLLAYLSSHSSVSTQEEKGQSLSFIQGNGMDLSEEFATLMSKRGHKVLLLDMTFSQRSQPQQEAGLLQFLEGEASAPTILSSDLFDRIHFGGTCSHSNELVGSKRFLVLLDQLKTQYDWVVGVTNAKPASAEAENILHLFDNAAITISSETLQDLSQLIHLISNFPEEHKVSFMITDFS